MESDRSASGKKEFAQSKQTLLTALDALHETRQGIPLGSTNINPIHKSSKSSLRIKPLTDKLSKKEDVQDKEKELVYSPDKVNKYSDKIIIYSPLFERHSRRKMLDALVDAPITTITQKRIEEIRFETDKVLRNTEGMPSAERRVQLRATIAKLAKEFGAGNCEELATLAFFTLLKNGYQGKIEFVACRGVDHVFVILNRPEKSDPTNWQTWGKYTIVLDPWINKVFRADTFGHIWKHNTLRLHPDELITFVKFDDSAFRSIPDSGLNPT